MKTKSIFSKTAVPMIMMSLVFGPVALPLSASAEAERRSTTEVIDITKSLVSKEHIYTSYSRVAHDLNDLNRKEALKAWIHRVNSEKQDLRVRNYMSNFYRLYKDTILSKSILDLAGHYYFTEDLNNFRAVISYYYFQAGHFILNNAANPRLSDSESPRAESLAVASKVASAMQSLNACLKSSTPAPGNDPMVGAQSVKVACLDKNPDLTVIMTTIKNIIGERSFRGSPMPSNFDGYIPGNLVEQLTQNDYSPEMIATLVKMDAALRTATHAKANKKYIEMTVDDFKNVMATPADALSLFTESGLPRSLDPMAKDGHPIYKPMLPNGEKNIFGEIYKSVGQAKETLFVDVYFIGGSMGAIFAKKVIDQMQKNPDLKVVILNDRQNAMGYEIEMRPVFHFLRAYAEKFAKDRMVVASPRIDLKKTSMPPFLDLLVSDEMMKKIVNTETLQSLTEGNRFYPKGKSDHSKVFLMDAQNPQTGVAYVGSKNITDASGGISYDEVTKIQGPAVLAILNSYYYDLLETLKADPFYAASSMQLVKSFDVLGRQRTSDSAPNTVKGIKKGNAIVTLGENNVYGSIRTPLMQNIEAIMSAERQIIVSDQFVYDPFIVRALIEAKRRKNHLQIHVMLAQINNPVDMLDPDLRLAHMPNVLFVDEMKAAGIQVKWKEETHAQIEAIKRGRDQFGITLSPEYHLKALSIDGVSLEDRKMCQQLSNETKIVDSPIARQQLSAKMVRLPILISGSANKDNMTMLGGFREFQLAIYDREASIKHDCLFWSRWDSRESSREVDVSKQFKAPDQVLKAGLTHEQFLQILKDLFIGLYNFKTEYF